MTHSKCTVAWPRTQVLMMTVECVAAIDQGTQSTRVTLYDSKAQVIGKAQRDLAQHRPQAG